ncbi:MAG: 4-hydroxythreonine-4-phosphate dehydrogenase PdxA [Candidatus Cloacimonetes bacterium]|nr:4-hydroxythreonine-4-phosphate dehydrogenase PdxA [Candidatus Cloacimonadota bacterium]
MNKLGITLGDPTGIGPEVVKKALINYSPKSLTILYGALPQNFEFKNLQKISTPEQATDKNTTYWIPIKEEKKYTHGKPSLKSGLTAFESIEKAGYHAQHNKISAITTAPLSKKYVQKTNPEFIGHTEFFAKQSNTEHFVMCFYSKKLIVALLTTHLALKDLHKELCYAYIYKQIKLVNSSIKKIKNATKPKLALLGVNPHSGENGSFGTIEIELFEPLVKNLQKNGIDITGPYSADTFFASKYKDFDAIISPYHDQGLIPFKMLTFGEGVNVTLGLPYVRTSVDHGTAFDIAGKNKANCGSMIEAIKLAERLI